MPLLFYFIITLIYEVSRGQRGVFNVVQGVGDWEGVHIFNPQLLIDHSTEANVISTFSFKNTEVVQLLFIFIPPLTGWGGGGYTVLPLSVLPSIPRYFSLHFSQQLLMAEI